MTCLSTDAPRVNPASFRDPSGAVVELDGRIFRGVDATCLDIVRSMCETGLLSSLIEDGLIVETSILEDVALAESLREACPEAAGFLEHKRIHPISYPYEWSPAMLAAAGILTLDLQIRLLEHGYSLKDATAYNIQFVDGRPIFIDIASIERPQRLDMWFALGQFGRMFTLPLLLNRCKGQCLRSYFLANLDGRDVGDVRRAFGRLELLKPGLWLDLTLPYLLGRGGGGAAVGHDAAAKPDRPTSATSQLVNLRRLRGKLCKLAEPPRRRGAWASYTRTCTYQDAATASKMDAVRGFLNETRPDVVLDVGANTGEYTFLSQACGSRVVAVDSDADCIDQMHGRVRDERLPILPLCMDMANPSPAIGFCNRERPSFLERVSADCVLALAVIHHLHVTANLPVESIRDLFAGLTRRWLVLEFVPTADAMFQSLMRFRVDLYQNFTLERCIEIFSERFRLMERCEVRDSARTLLFWEKTQ